MCGSTSLKSWDTNMLSLAGALVLYLVEPSAGMIFILLTGFSLYNPDDGIGVVMALLFLGIIRRAFFTQRS